MQTLDEIFINHKTDKSSLSHNYSSIYESLFEPIRFNNINILEIGIYKGESILSWLDYFPYASIFGVDVEDHFNYTHDRFYKCIGNCLDEKLSNRLNYLFDIIIDDASHICEEQIELFNLMFPRLKEGGIYVVEDIDTSYMKGAYYTQNNGNFIDFIRQKIDDVHLGGKFPYMADRAKIYSQPNFNTHHDNIDEIIIKKGICIFKKGRYT